MANKKWLSEDAEIKIYEFLGIKIFRKMVFTLERVIHHFDKQKNENYHLKNLEPSAIEAFIQYLFYNGSIHARNTVVLVIYLVIKMIITSKFGFYDGVISCFLLKDIYCVMLQRYNYIRIKKRKKRVMATRQLRIKKMTEKIQNNMPGNYISENVRADLELTERILSAIHERKSIALSEGDIDKLIRITAVIDSSYSQEGAYDGKE